jgi:hypothetical protein
MRAGNSTTVALEGAVKSVMEVQLARRYRRPVELRPLTRSLLLKETGVGLGQFAEWPFSGKGVFSLLNS